MRCGNIQSTAWEKKTKTRKDSKWSCKIEICRKVTEMWRGAFINYGDMDAITVMHKNEFVTYQNVKFKSSDCHFVQFCWRVDKWKKKITRHDECRQNISSGNGNGNLKLVFVFLTECINKFISISEFWMNVFRFARNRTQNETTWMSMQIGRFDAFCERWLFWVLKSVTLALSLSLAI